MKTLALRGTATKVAQELEILKFVLRRVKYARAESSPTLLRYRAQAVQSERTRPRGRHRARAVQWASTRAFRVHLRASLAHPGSQQ